jgi:hypothetical protein
MARKSLVQPAVPIVTSLPTSPVDGQVVDYLADATNGVIWRFRYRAASSSAYKWELVGGTELEAVVKRSSAENVIGTSSYAASTTPGPSITLPLAGDYDITLSFASYHGVAGGAIGMSYDIGATPAVDADSLWIHHPTTSVVGRVTRTKRKTGLPATTLTCKYRALSGTGVLAGDPSNLIGASQDIRVRPVRVG